MILTLGTAWSGFGHVPLGRAAEARDKDPWRLPRTSCREEGCPLAVHTSIDTQPIFASRGGGGAGWGGSRMLPLSAPLRFHYRCDTGNPTRFFSYLAGLHGCEGARYGRGLDDGILVGVLEVLGLSSTKRCASRDGTRQRGQAPKSALAFFWFG